MNFAHIIIKPIDYTEVIENFRAHAENVMLTRNMYYHNKPTFPQRKDTAGMSRGELIVGANNCVFGAKTQLGKFLSELIIFGIYDTETPEDECMLSLFIAEYLESDFPAYLASLPATLTTTGQS